MRSRLVVRTLLVGAIIAISRSNALGAQDKSTDLGARGGYNFETDELVVSANLIVPMTSRVDFYPSVDIYRPEKGNKIGFNGDVKIRFPKLGQFFYAGFGAGVISRTIGADSSHTEFGGNLLLGLQARIGWFHPFAEGRAVFRDKSQIQAFGGFNISRGP